MKIWQLGHSVAEDNFRAKITMPGLSPWIVSADERLGPEVTTSRANQCQSVNVSDVEPKCAPKSVTARLSLHIARNFSSRQQWDPCTQELNHEPRRVPTPIWHAFRKAQGEELSPRPTQEHPPAVPGSAPQTFPHQERQSCPVGALQNEGDKAPS